MFQELETKEHTGCSSSPRLSQNRHRKRRSEAVTSCPGHETTGFKEKLTPVSVWVFVPAFSSFFTPEHSDCKVSPQTWCCVYEFRNAIQFWILVRPGGGGDKAPRPVIKRRLLGKTMAKVQLERVFWDCMRIPQKHHQFFFENKNATQHQSWGKHFQCVAFLFLSPQTGHLVLKSGGLA